jgi:hypothetical protein
MLMVLHSRAFKIAVRAGTVLGALLLFGVAGAMAAVAQTSYPPPTGVAPEVVTKPKPGGGVAPAATAPLAFTGAELTLLLVGFAVLVAAGALAIIAARRRGNASA